MPASGVSVMCCVHLECLAGAEKAADVSTYLLSRTDGRAGRSASGVRVVFAFVSESPGQVAHDLAEDAGVHVLADHVEQEPVADARLSNDDVDGVSADEPQAHVQEVGAYPRADHQQHSERVVDERQAGQAQKPEPQEHVQLLVHNVQRQDAQHVHDLYVARGAVFPERAFGHAWEHPDERVDAILRVLL